jgi:hypothetical protein
MPQPNDLSRSLVALDQNSTIIAVVEMSQSSWLVGGILPGIERQPSELVSRMELRKSSFWDPDGKMDPFPRRSAYLRDCYYAYFSSAGIAAAADFPVYQRHRRLD